MALFNHPALETVRRSNKDLGPVRATMERSIDELEKTLPAVSQIIVHMIEDEKRIGSRVKQIGERFGQWMDPLHNGGIVTHTVDGNTQEIVKDMARGNSLGIGEFDSTQNDAYVTAMTSGRPVDNSFHDKDQARRQVEFALSRQSNELAQPLVEHLNRIPAEE